MQREAQDTIADITNKLVIAPISHTHIGLPTKIAEKCLGIPGADLTYLFMDPRRFSVGEFCPKFVLNDEASKTLEGKTVYVILTPGPHKDPDGLMGRARKVADAAKENGAKKVVLLTTDLIDARQDRGPGEDPKAKGELNSVRHHARLFHASGIDEVITTHEHSPRISSFYAIEYGLIPPEWLPEEARKLKPRDLKVPEHVNADNEKIQQLGRKVFKSINPYNILADYLLHHSSLVGTSYLTNQGAGLALKAMDRGNKQFIDSLFNALFMKNVVRLYCKKARVVKNDPDSVEVEVIGVSDNFDTLDGKVEIYADDGLDTGGTMLKAVEWSRKGNICAETGKKYGTPKNRLIYLTHPWLGGEGYLNIQEKIFKKLPAKEFITTNTRPYITDVTYYRSKSNLTVLKFAGLWADAIIANELSHNLMTRYAGFESEEQQHGFLGPLYSLKRHSEHFLVDRELEKREVIFNLRT